MPCVSQCHAFKETAGHNESGGMLESEGKFESNFYKYYQEVHHVFSLYLFICYMLLFLVLSLITEVLIPIPYIRNWPSFPIRTNKTTKINLFVEVKESIRNGITKACMEGMVEGNRSRGRPARR